ncbi:hypothetical protein GQR60_00210 [Labilibaculum sp. A4]|uniref:Uncharacterized protein n=1 Tax=Labilibaculum euxinus TaxID=2686357 RepID=A0A425YGG7_9BACT|nr:hypothetical protein [Labilibaculum euxinus]MDQ1769238.1 hypothetical protein [Labilibaculum euxinus]MUP36828.1 hypothetical protein [Labilibaculum euxinus]MVB06033.1 hypothetical protein [Labilibaculum euxinus]MWN74762.1 hypothetical protein [Labilibaculum euxinus]
MLKARKFFALLIGTLVVTGSLFAQEGSGNGEISFGADLMNRYVWRGTQFSTGPVIQPSVEYSNGGFALGAWGSYAQNGADGAEADLYASYTFADDLFTATVTDYFFPTDGIAVNNSYFDYKKASTGHIMEATLAFNGSDGFPISILAAMNFWGADQDTNGDQQNSLYIELGYGFKYKEVAIDLFAGFTPIDADESKGESGFYGDTAGFVNMGFTASKEIAITDKFSLPVSASVIANPMAENLFLVFGVSF